ncbi:hypothetical protein XAC3810_730022 [Xanthomonas citri pv. citri]|uniref:Uncharacterized protein n=3 Tax=Xanthomonas citri TaxID=346 RepID=A0A0U5BXA9_XANCI|nr:hypothetical protein XAC902_1040023 [Xanthomonas citri pv. citri]CEE20362.1 hypothetical protein XAC908_1020023 [Xanthomonas citri pv. citri]CEE37201.1 hypothetical protein XAC3824_880022 [Xanthomonas citri pv. citri]CEE38402.1 hypothetical protein XAC1083_720023 [Xanthomonas citri pv. citri]CEE46478.1 hypothetical protein XAC3810_730022 [Xanthomonas citri pv. citri]
MDWRPALLNIAPVPPMQRKAWIKPGYSPAWGIDQTPGIGFKWMNTKRRIISAHLSYRFSHFMMATAAMDRHSFSLIFRSSDVDRS